MIRRLKSSLLVGAVLAALSTPAMSEMPHAGQVSWSSGIASFSEALCGFSADDFGMVARTEGVRLRIFFEGNGTLDSIDFSTPSTVRIFFTDEHVLSGEQFAMYRSMGEMGEIEASPDGASGQLHLRPATAEALDNRPNGMEIAYDFHCTGELF